MNTTPNEPRYISLSHIMPPMTASDIHFFVIPTGQEAHLECKDDLSRYIYQTILQSLQGAPKTKAEVLGSLSTEELGAAQQAEKIFDALAQKNIISDVSGLAGAFAPAWQNNPAYDPIGYTTEAEAEQDRRAYEVAPGTVSHRFAAREYYARHSTRHFDSAATITVEQIERLLADTYRTKAGEPHPLPSPGGIYPVRLHLIQPANRIVDDTGNHTLAAGIYQYDPQHLTLERRTSDAFPGKNIVDYLVNKPDAADSVAYIAVSVDTQAFARKYGNASLMFQGITVGGVAQRVTDAAEQLGLGTLSLFGIKHVEADRILGHPANIKTVLMIAVGKELEIGKTHEAQSGFKQVIEKLRVGAKRYLLASGNVNLGDTAYTGMPNTFVCMCVKHPQLITNGKTIDGYAFGTALTEDEALLKATAEALERVTMSNVRVDRPFSTASALDASWIDPRIVMPMDREQLQEGGLQKFTPQLAVNWTKGRRHKTRENVYAPSALVYYPYIPHAGEPHITNTTSSGVAAHFNREQAIESALLELIERDAIMRAWVAKQPPAKIDPESLPHSLRFRVAELNQYGKQVDILKLKTDSPAPAFMVTIRSDKFPYFYAGAAAKPSAQEAIHKALDEAAAGFSSRIMLERYLKKEDASKTAKGIFDADSHGMFYAQNAKAREAIGWLFSGEYIPFGEPSIKPAFDELVNLYDPAVFDLDNPAEGNELIVVRVICEDLVPIQFGKTGVPYLHHTLPAGLSRPELPHFFN